MEGVDWRRFQRIRRKTLSLLFLPQNIARKMTITKKKKVSFFLKSKVRRKAIHHFKAKKISFPQTYNSFTEN